MVFNHFEKSPLDLTKRQLKKKNYEHDLGWWIWTNTSGRTYDASLVFFYLGANLPDDQVEYSQFQLSRVW